MSEIDLRWPKATKDAGEAFPVELGCFALCATFWGPNEEHQVGDMVWPRITVENGEIVRGSIGLLLECTVAGRTSAKEPRWVNVNDDGQSMADAVHPDLDGSVQWTYRRAVGLDGVSEVSDPALVSVTPAGLTVSAIIVNEGTKLLLDYQGGEIAEGEEFAEYEVELEFFISGRRRIGRQIVEVRKK